MMLPAGLAPATVSFEASRADLLRYGSVKVIRPRATEPQSCRPVADGLPFLREMARRCSWDQGRNAKGESGCPTWNRTKIYGFRDRRATVALQGRCCAWQVLHTAVKVAWPDHPKAIGPRFIGDELFRWHQRQKGRGAESPDHFLGCIGIKSARVVVFYIHRRKCHLAAYFYYTNGRKVCCRPQDHRIWTLTG